jgi:hypothetical protein
MYLYCVATRETTVCDGVAAAGVGGLTGTRHLAVDVCVPSVSTVACSSVRFSHEYL